MDSDRHSVAADNQRNFVSRFVAAAMFLLLRFWVRLHWYWQPGSRFGLETLNVSFVTIQAEFAFALRV